MKISGGYCVVPMGATQDPRHRYVGELRRTNWTVEQLTLQNFSFRVTNHACETFQLKTFKAFFADT